MYLSDDLREMEVNKKEINIMYQIEVNMKDKKQQFAKVIDTKAGRKKESIERLIRKTESLRKSKNKKGRTNTESENKSSKEFLSIMSVYLS